jgi:hypothetical protein
VDAVCGCEPTERRFPPILGIAIADGVTCWPTWLRHAVDKKKRGRLDGGGLIEIMNSTEEG